MLSSFPFAVIIGSILGVLSGLGTGGGSLLILWLTLGLGMAQPEARAINLMFFIPSAVVSCLFRWRQGRLDIKKVLPAIVAGSVAAGSCAYFGSRMDTSLLQKLFGGLLIFTGIRELMYKPRER